MAEHFVLFYSVGLENKAFTLWLMEINFKRISGKKNEKSFRSVINDLFLLQNNKNRTVLLN